MRTAGGDRYISNASHCRESGLVLEPFAAFGDLGQTSDTPASRSPSAMGQNRIWICEVVSITDPRLGPQAVASLGARFIKPEHCAAILT
jgi:hypothetical protein